MINQDCSEALIRESLQMRWFCDLEVQGEHSVDWLFKVKLIHVCFTMHIGKYHHSLWSDHMLWSVFVRMLKQFYFCE